MTRFCQGEEQIIGMEGQTVELKYYILKQEMFYEDLSKEITAYGIEIEKTENAIVETSRLEDITCNKEEIDSITRVLKENKVLPIHLQDIVLDMLS